MSPLKTNFVKTQIDDELQFCLKVIMKIFKFEMVDIWENFVIVFLKSVNFKKEC